MPEQPKAALSQADSEPSGQTGEPRAATPGQEAKLAPPETPDNVDTVPHAEPQTEVRAAESQPDAPVVEPLLGLEEFVVVAHLGRAAEAALKKWLQMQRLGDAYGHRTLPEWQAALTQTLSHT